MDRRRFLRDIGLLSCGAAGAAGNPAVARVRGQALDDVGGSPPERVRDGSAGTVPANEGNWDVAWRATPEDSETWGPYSELDLKGWPSGLDLTHRDGRVVLAGPDLVAFDARDGDRAWINRDLEVTHSAVDEDLLVVESATDGESSQLVGLSLSWGERRWTVELDRALETDPVIAGSTVFAPVDGDLMAYDRTDGTQHPSWEFEHPVTDVTVDEGTAYVTTEATFVAFDIETGERRWTVEPVGVLRLSRPRLDRTTGTVVALDEDDGIEAATTGGEAAWRAVEPLLTEPVSTLAVGNGYCVAVPVNGPDADAPTGSTLVCLDLETGTVVWRHTFPPMHDRIEPSEVPVLAPTVVDGTVWAATNGVVDAIDAESGTLQRRWGLPDRVVASPVVTDDGVGFLDPAALYWLDPEGECDHATDASVSVKYTFPVPNARSFELEGTLGSTDCAGLDTVELWVEGNRIAFAGTYSPAGQRGDVEVYRTVGDQYVPPQDPEATVVIRDTSGTVVSERLITVDDYRTGPGRFRIICASVEADQVSVGETVSTTTTVRNNGGDSAEYTLTLLADGSPVDERTGSLAQFIDDYIQECEGADLKLAHAFEDPGEYELSVSITPTGDEGSGDSESLGTITVTESNESDGGGWPTAAVVSGTAITAAAGGATYWWRSRYGTDDAE